ncbi:unnamed protein product [Sphenostylis stenocarpa]|uniref:Uncharacterized protein n=1 Tax=Sphenostylis stenocarpa TaxID=92480 RepID=A0AA86TN23_9FABA|nr:unnamed protein product [Sphenostylis stenocarpa]
MKLPGYLVKIGVAGTGTAILLKEAFQSSNRSLDIAFMPSRGEYGITSISPFDVHRGLFPTIAGRKVRDCNFGDESLTDRVPRLYVGRAGLCFSSDFSFTLEKMNRANHV